MRRDFMIGKNVGFGPETPPVGNLCLKAPSPDNGLRTTRFLTSSSLCLQAKRSSKKPPDASPLTVVPVRQSRCISHCLRKTQINVCCGGMTIGGLRVWTNVQVQLRPCCPPVLAGCAAAIQAARDAALTRAHIFSVPFILLATENINFYLAVCY